jgi:acyl-CoA thioesterase-2
MLSHALISNYRDQAPKPDDDFLTRLQLKQVDRDVFTGWCHAGAPLRAFGGQVAAQALVAASATVEEDTRSVHSLHAYFLRPGHTTDHIVYMVDRPRDGRSFSTRRVRAIQYGKTIFTMSASFASAQRGPEHQRLGRPPVWWQSAPAPDRLPPERVFDHVTVAEDVPDGELAAALVEQGYPTQQRFDLRVIEPSHARELSGGLYDRMVWLRSAEDLPNDPVLNVCILTYFSDLNMVGTVTDAHGGRSGTRGLEMASLDHAMWFHNRFWTDEWMLFATDSPAAGFGRGFARGEFFRADGLLAASTAQEVLIRQPHRKR